MFANVLKNNESKTLEFKENLASPLKIVKTVIAFANTAGGLIVIGVTDKTRKVVGVDNILVKEERLTNLISETIEPQLIPDIEIITYKNKELLLIKVPYIIGPYYLKKSGIERGTYIRLGSSVRLADAETRAALRRLVKQVSFDELPCLNATVNDIDDNVIQTTLKPIYKNLTKQHYESLDILTRHQNKLYPSYGAILLFSKNRLRWFPDAMIQCVCFSGNTRSNIIDQKDIKANLIDAIDEVIMFINRHTSVAAKIGPIKREEVPEYPSEAIREAVINAIIHTDYSIKGSSVQIAIFAGEIQITNPGGLTFGQTIENVLAGISKMRNRMMGRIFRELKLIEKLGSGIPRIIAAYANRDAKSPKIEEMDSFFRVTLYKAKVTMEMEEWEEKLIRKLSQHNAMSTKEIAKIWQLTERAARTRLNKMIKKGLIVRNALSKTDPTATYSLLKR